MIGFAMTAREKYLEERIKQLKIAMQKVPLIGKLEKVENFRKRQDKWMDEYYYPTMKDIK